MAAASDAEAPVDPPATSDAGGARATDPGEDGGRKRGGGSSCPPAFTPREIGVLPGPTAAVVALQLADKSIAAINSSTSQIHVFDPATEAWTDAGSLGAARGEEFSTTLLVDGNVLVTGGVADSYNAIGSAEVYVTATKSSRATKTPMSKPHRMHTTTRLLDGRVLITGGLHAGQPQASAELYDPTTDTFTSVGNMNAGRMLHAAALLEDGRVLVAGGYEGSSWWVPTSAGALASAEVFDPSTGQFTPVASMTKARNGLRLSLLVDGRVVAAGGATPSGYVAEAEVFDPNTSTWTTAGSLPTAVSAPSVTSLGCGAELFAGGYGGGASVTDVTTFDPTSLAFRRVATLKSRRHSPLVAELPGGRIFVGFGSPGSGWLTTCEVLE